MGRRPIIAGNWKLNPDSVEQARELADAVAEGDVGEVDVVLIPPAVFIAQVRQAVAGAGVAVGAQNMHPAANGAFTGEVSGSMLRSLGCAYVVCGHSERRGVFGETSEFVGEKVAAALQVGLTPILCCGETRSQRDGGSATAVVAQQLRDGLAALDAEAAARCVLAYEPVWAIGTGLTATPQQAEETHAFIRHWLVERFDRETAETIRIQYGGSVKPHNAAELLAQPNIDGALVGGASLKAESFLAIVGCASRS